MGAELQELQQAVATKLGNRNLIWLGVRGDDALPLLCLPQFKNCFSLTARCPFTGLERQLCLEELTQCRVNLNKYNMAADNSEQYKYFHNEFLAACSIPSVLAAYSSWPIMTTARVVHNRTLQAFGLIHERKNCFENRAWVECELRDIGVPVIPWQYTVSGNGRSLCNALKKKPQVIRFNRSSGGANFKLIADWNSEFTDCRGSPELLAFAPYLNPNIPLSVGGCLYPSGEVSWHGPALQLIGLKQCTDNVFAYCGNDFGKIKELPIAVLAAMERTCLTVAKWLHREHYIGAFGIDLLCYEDKVVFVEINPRFIGGARISAELDRRLGRADLFLEHIAAWFGLPAPRYISLADLAQEQDMLAQIYCYNKSNRQAVIQESCLSGLDGIEILPKEGSLVETGGTLFRLVFPAPVTDCGHEVFQEVELKLDVILRKSVTYV